MADELESMGIPDGLFQIREVLCIHIEDPAAFYTSDVVVIVALMVITVCASRYFNFAYPAFFGKPLQIPVYGTPADRRIVVRNRFVNFICGCVALQLIDCF